MTAGNCGPMRASDADRENVRSILQSAHAEGRLNLDEFDRRCAALTNAETYDQLAQLTADLPNQFPGQPAQFYPGATPGYPGATPGYMGTPTPMGYQGTPTGIRGVRIVSLTGGNGQGVAGGILRIILMALVSPVSLLRWGQGSGMTTPYRRYVRYVRIAFVFIAVGLILYYGFVKHQWVNHSDDPDPGP